MGNLVRPNNPTQKYTLINPIVTTIMAPTYSSLNLFFVFVIIIVITVVNNIVIRANLAQSFEFDHHQSLSDYLLKRQQVEFVDQDGMKHTLRPEPARKNGTSLFTWHLNGTFIGETTTVDSENVQLLRVWLLDVNYNLQAALANLPHGRSMATSMPPPSPPPPLPPPQSSQQITSGPPIRPINNRGAPILAHRPMPYGWVKPPPPPSKPYISFHSWRSSYFDSYQIIEMEPDTIVSDMEPFSINGQDFLAVALRSTKLYDLRVPEVFHYYNGTSQHNANNIRPYYNTNNQFQYQNYHLGPLWGPMSVNQPREAISKIYRLDLSEGKLNWILYQSLPTNRALDLAAFSFVYDSKTKLSENYLALLGQLEGQPFGIHVLKYVGDKFAPIELIVEPKAVAIQVKPYNMGDNMVLTAYLDDGAIVNYSFDGLPKGIARPPPPVNDTERLEGLLGWCTQNIREILNDGFDGLRDTFERLPRVNQLDPIELFGDLVVENDISINHLLATPKFIELENDTLRAFDRQLPPAADPLITFQHLQAANEQIQQMKNEVERILVNDGSSQVVRGRLIFDQVTLHCYPATGVTPNEPNGRFQCPYVVEINTPRLNRMNISDLAQQAFLTGRSQTIMEDVRFEHLVLSGDVQINGRLDGYYIDDIVFKKGPQAGPIYGHKKFNFLIANSNVNAGLINNRRIDRSTVLVTTGDQIVSTPIIVNEVILARSPFGSHIDIFNGLNLTHFFNHLVLADSNVAVGVPVEFDRLIVNGPMTLAARSLLSGIDIEDLAAKLLMRHGDQVVVAPMFISDLNLPFGGDITVNGSVNNINSFYRGNIVMNDQNFTLRNPITFDKDVYSTRDVIIRGIINGIPIQENRFTGRREPTIMYLTGEQEIVGQKVFNEVYLAGNSQIMGNINGHLNLTELYHLSQHQGPYRFGNVQIDGQIEIMENAPFIVEGLVNGVDIADLCKQATLSPFIQYGELHFDHPISFNNLICDSINGIRDLANTFMTTYTDQFVNSHLLLNNGMLLNTSMTIMATMNNMSVAPLEGSLRKSLEELMSGRKEIFGDLFVEDLLVERINNLTMKEVIQIREKEVLINGTMNVIPQFISGSLQFEDVEIENVLDIGRDMSASHINGVNLTDLFHNTLMYDKPQFIHSPVRLNTLQIPKGQNLVVNKRGLNGINLAAIYNDAVLKDTEQVITGAKIFNAGAHFDRFVFHRTLDGVTDQDLKMNWLLNGVDQVIDRDVEFTQDLIVKNGLQITTGIINDININQLAQSMVRNEPRSRSYRINGNGSIILKNVKLHELEVAGKIQGIDLSKEGVKNTNAPILLTGRKHFLNGFTVNGAMSHSIYDIVELCKLPAPELPRPPPPPPPSLPPPPPPPPVQIPWRPIIPLPTPVQTSPRPPQPPPQPVLVQTPVRPILPPSPPKQTPVQPIPILPPPPQQTPVQVQVRPMPPPPPSPSPPPPVQVTWRPVLPSSIPVQIPLRPFSPSPIPVQTPVRPMPPPPPPVQTSPRPILAPAQKLLPMPPALLRPIPPPRYLLPPAPQANTSAPKYMKNLIVTLPDLSREALMIREFEFRHIEQVSYGLHYDIVLDKHPDLGPALHVARNPFTDTLTFLLTKSLNMAHGAPCLTSNQAVTFFTKQFLNSSIFKPVGELRETKNPTSMDSITANGDHYLFALNKYPHEEMMHSEIMVFSWNKTIGRHELFQKLPIVGTPTQMRAFSTRDQQANMDRLCLFVTDLSIANSDGRLRIICQEGIGQQFVERNRDKGNIPIRRVFRFDALVDPVAADSLLMATLSVADGKQTSHLHIVRYSLVHRSTVILTTRKVIKPGGIHLFKDIEFIENPMPTFDPHSPVYLSRTYLALGEETTSLNDAQAFTNIYELLTVEQFPPGMRQIQTIRTRSVHSIQSAALENGQSLLMLLESDFVQVYGARAINQRNLLERDCYGDRFNLRTSVPTKGANNMIVFQDLNGRNKWLDGRQVGRDHFIVLTKEDCAQRLFSTIILKSRFDY